VRDRGRRAGVDARKPSYSRAYAALGRRRGPLRPPPGLWWASCA